MSSAPQESPLLRPNHAPVALVTGGGRGIGRASALRLAQEGYSVCVTARSVTELEETARAVRRHGRPVLVVPGDITDPAAVQQIQTIVVAELGVPDVVVNNAAYTGPMGTLWEVDPDEWVKVLTTNVAGPVRLLHALLPAMLTRGHGYVVNLNSLQGSDSSGSPLAYGASKAALMRLTDGLAAQLAGTGVVVVDLSPGLVRTVMTSNRPDLEVLPESAWAPPEQAADQLLRLVSGRYDHLHGRFVRAGDDLDALSVLLKSDPDARILRLQTRAIAR